MPTARHLRFYTEFVVPSEIMERYYPMSDEDENFTVLVFPNEISDLLEYVEHLNDSNFAVVWATDEAELFTLVQEQQPDLLLIDITKRTDAGLALCQEVIEDNTLVDLPVIILDNHSTEDSMVRGLKIGAIDYVTPATTKNVLLARIRNYIALYQRLRQQAAKPQLERHDSDRETTTSALPHELENEQALLTEREIEILKLYAGGHSRSQIASALELSANTIHWHLKQIYGKLGINTKAEAVTKAQSLGL